MKQTTISLIFLAIFCTFEVSCRPQRKHNNDLFEGDILLSRDQKDEIFFPKKFSKKNLVVERFRWPTKRVNGENIVEVPYIYDSGVSSSVKDLHKETVEKFNTLTCIRFIPRTSQRAYIKIIKGDGCYSTIGYKGKEQLLSLDDGCEYLGTVIHESLHAIGLFHEQSRLDRDEFVKILWGNIQSGKENQFEKYDSSWGIGWSELRRYPYDLNSLMSYKNKAFSKNGLDTIQDKQNPKARIGQNKFFSTGDLFKVNSMYNCAGEYLNAKNYKITVETSNDWWSGTDARVFLKIFKKTGSKKDSGEIELKKGQFESGDVDVETHLLPDVTPIGEIIVWHSNEGTGAGWKLVKVVIEDMKTKQKYTFNYNGWLEGDPSANRKILKPN